MRKPPPVREVAYADVLAHYGQTMEYVQAFEYTMKCIVFMHRYTEVAARGPVDDSDIIGLLDNSKIKTLKRVLDSVKLEWKRLGLPPLPQIALKLIDDVVILRNHLAHDYLAEHARAMTDPEGRKLMVAELYWYSELFMSIDATLGRPLDWLITHHGLSLHGLEIECGPIVHRSVLERLRKKLQTIGIVLADPPSGVS